MRQDITLDVRKRETSFGRAKLPPLRRGEKGNRELVVSIEEDGRAYDLSGKTASLVATTAAGKLVGPCPMEVAEAGIARIMLPAALYSAVGAFSGYVEIREGETLVDTTDSFGGKVIECADLDSEQAAEFTPLLGELQNAVAEEAKRVEAEKARAQAEAEREAGFAEAKQAAQNATTAANDAAADANLAAGTASDAAESATTAAIKATDAAAKAESDVRAFVNAAGTAVGDAIAAAREDVDAAVKRSDAASAKAEAAVKTADAANTAATQAVSDAREAIAEVKATEAKLYPAAENILVGSETGAVAHVDDAFDGAALRKITVEGACKQDGIPSPEEPKPIAVIEHPTVKVVGRNLLRYKEGFAQSTVNGVTYTPLQDGGIKMEGLATVNSYFNLDFGVGVKPRPVKAFAGKSWAIDSGISDYFVAGVLTESGVVYTVNNNTVPNDAATFRCFVRVFAGASVNKTIYPAIYLQSLSDYKPYTEQSITFTLPAEHPYLAKLPDGTADEIVVDEEGNVELVARVSKATLVASKIVDTWGKGYAIYSWPKDGRYSPHATSDGTAVICDKLKAETGANIYRGLGIGISVGSTIANNKSCVTTIALGDGADLSSIDGASFLYPLMTPVRYKLAPIEMPKAQDSIVNVWTDAEVTPNTGIGYVRDVNIVVANLESAIASITEG
ncbi:BppU family phage baseplate upper protein [uncultured Slackia sp.]|uniref:BppU family phage baseplate upper protein n=1 Tax=uncultured Slackia sp. TaxID=665903 RepID=UPI0025852D97|nr:BppU family phage baseplate upper protein [uncultured Slackia sp.]